MSNFLDLIKAKAEQVENNSGEDEREPVPAGGWLTLSNEKPTVKVRILPSVEFATGQTQDPTTFGERVERIFFQTKHQSKNGKFASANWNIGGDKETWDLINRWTEEGKMSGGRFGNYSPSVNYLLNVIELDDNNAPVDNIVKVMRVTKKVYNELIAKMADTDTWLEGSQMGWLDPNYANPVRITRPAQGSNDGYQVEVYSNKQLPPMDYSALATVLEPLSNFTKPSRLTIPDYFNQIVAWMDGTGVGGGTNPYEQEATQGGAFNTAPVQPQAPSYPFGGATQQPAPAPVAPSVPAQQAPVAPMQQQAPTQPVAPAPVAPVQQAPAFTPAPAVDPHANPLAQPSPAPVAPAQPQAPVANDGDDLTNELNNILGLQ